MIATRARTEPYLATKRVDLGSETSRGSNVSFLRAERVGRKGREEEGGWTHLNATRSVLSMLVAAK